MKNCLQLLWMTLIVIQGLTSQSTVNLWLDSASVSQGSEHCVSLRADNFTAIGSIQGTLSWNPSVITFTAIGETSLPDFDSSMMNMQQTDAGILPFLWFDRTAINPVTIPEGGVVFSACFLVNGNPGSSTEIDIIDKPLKIELSSLTNELEIVDHKVRSGLLTVVGDDSICVSDNTVDVSNLGTTENGLWDGYNDISMAIQNAPKADLYFPQEIINLSEEDSGVLPEDLANLFDDSTSQNINEGIPYAFPYIILGSENSEYKIQAIDVSYENIFSSFSDIVIPVGAGTKILREWTVLDWCSLEVVEGTQIIQVNIDETQESPVINCIDLSTALLDQGMVEIFACDFVKNAFDAETEEGDLRFTFSSVRPEEDPTFNESINCSAFTFTCNDIPNDEEFVETTIYVWDEDGNSDFCTVSLFLIDNQSACSDDNADCKILACNKEIKVLLNDKGEASLSADIFLENRDCNTSDFLITIIDLSGVEITEGIGRVLLTEAGIFSYTITDPKTENTCFGMIIVEEVGSTSACDNPCRFDACDSVNGIIWPPNYGVEPNQTSCGVISDSQPVLIDLSTDTGVPIFPKETDSLNCELLIGFAVESDTFFISDECLKILNQWTVINWCVYNPESSDKKGIYEHDQIIRINLGDTDCTEDSECGVGSLSCNDKITVSLDTTGIALLTPDIFLEGSYGDCTYEIQILLPNSTTIAYEGTNAVFIDRPGEYTYQIIDVISGNLCWGSLFVEESGGTTGGCEVSCIIDLCDPVNGIIWPSNFTGKDSDNSTDCGQQLASQEPITSINVDTGEPTIKNITDECLKQLAFSFKDDIQFDIEGYCIKIIRNWTVLNWCTGTVVSHIQTIFFDGIIECGQPNDDCLILACLDKVAIQNEKLDTLLLFAEDFLLSSDCDVSNFEIIISDDDIELASGIGSVILTPNITGDLFYRIIDPNTGNSCWGSLAVIGGAEAQGLICDYLPWSAPITDCDGGHTLEDDVEWPDHIAIADYRISPREMMQLDMVDSRNAVPTIINNQSIYNVDYFDELIDLTPTSLSLVRRWTLTRDDIPGNEWNFDQEIEVDITGFSNLMTANTMSGRAIPNVTVNGTYTTDHNGIAVIPDDSVNDILYQDDILNGINILDIVLLQEYILGLNQFNELQIIASDFNNDNQVSAIDLVEMRKLLLGLTNQGFISWRFMDMTESIDAELQPLSHQVGIKFGDVDDSASLDGTQQELEKANIGFENSMLSAGSVVSIPFFVTTPEEGMLGVEIRLTIDPSLVDGELAVTSDLPADYSFDWNHNEDGTLTVVITKLTASESFDFSSPIFQIDLSVNTDMQSSELLSLYNDWPSYFLDGGKNIKEIQLFDNLDMTSNTEELFHSEVLSVYPNPATNVLHFDLLDTQTGEDFKIQVYDLLGHMLGEVSNSSSISLEGFNSGTYLYQFHSKRKTDIGKFQILK